MLPAMKRFMAALALAAAFAAPAAAAERRYSVNDFDRLVIEGPFVVRLVTGRPSSAVATGSPEALERVSVEVQGRTLRVRPNRSAWGGYPGAAAGPVAIELTTRELAAASVNGAGSLAIDRVAGLRLDLAVEGTGRIGASALAVDNLVIGMIGSGRMQLGGRATEVRASVHGWGDIDGSALRAQGVNLVTDSAGRIALQAEREATVTATGIGEVEVTGAGACTVRGLSAAQVRCGNGRRR
jgi:hypothetical protein